MRSITVSKVVKHTNISAERKKRQINIPNSYIHVRNNLKSAQPAIGIIHNHSFGWLLLILDREANVLMAWTNCKAYQPIRARFMHVNYMRQRLLNLTESCKTFTLYTNNGSLIMPVPKTWSVRAYEGGIFNLLQTLMPSSSSSNHNIIETKNEHVKIPTYAEIHDLDPSITRAEYNKIYG
nr:lef-3 [Apis mellifera nudivirus]